MRRTLFIMVVLSLFTVGLVSAHGHDFAETKQLIDSGVSCDNLTDEQLEDIGDYYMEQMHPGEAHELMDNMMGGEGSESLKQVHITMARRLYCSDNVYIGYGMMGRGMMGSWMMGNYPFGYGSFGIIWALFFAAAIFLIAWIVYQFGMKSAAPETPLHILKKRYARGELTRNQFEKMKKGLE